MKKTWNLYRQGLIHDNIVLKIKPVRPTLYCFRYCAYGLVWHAGILVITIYANKHVNSHCSSLDIKAVMCAVACKARTVYRIPRPLRLGTLKTNIPFLHKRHLGIGTNLAEGAVLRILSKSFPSHTIYQTPLG